MARRVALIAGAGRMVPLLVAAFRERGETLRVFSLTGRDDLDWPDVEQIGLSDATLLLSRLKAFRPTHMTLAGGVHVSDAEREGLAAAFGLTGRFARSLGDIGLAVLVWIEAMRMRVRLVGAHEVLPELVAPLGQIGGPMLDPAHQEAVERAIVTARRVGRADLGQAVVTSLRRPIAAEDVGGTDGLLQRVAALRAQGLAGGPSMPLILAKALKPRQPRFADLPSIGPNTIVGAADAGISIVAVEAGQSLLIDRAQLVAAANERNVTVVGVRRG